MQNHADRSLLDQYVSLVYNGSQFANLILFGNFFSIGLEYIGSYIILGFLGDKAVVTFNLKYHYCSYLFMFVV